MFFVFFFNYTATTEIYPLSLHDALPIWSRDVPAGGARHGDGVHEALTAGAQLLEAFGLGHRSHHLHQGELACIECLADRKSTRLNSSHLVISYAVFCLKKKNTCILHTKC